MDKSKSMVLDYGTDCCFSFLYWDTMLTTLLTKGFSIHPSSSTLLRPQMRGLVKSSENNMRIVSRYSIQFRIHVLISSIVFRVADSARRGLVSFEDFVVFETRKDSSLPAHARPADSIHVFSF